MSQDAYVVFFTVIFLFFVNAVFWNFVSASLLKFAKQRAQRQHSAVAAGGQDA